MVALLISEVAEQTGFSATTLRYYEAIGLLPAPERTPAGYRRYGDDAVRRLRLIGRAKALGLTLDEVRDLTELWDRDACGAVQEHLRHVVADKAVEGRARLHDLQVFVAALDRAVLALDEPARAGPCTDACACFGAVEPAPGRGSDGGDLDRSGDGPVAAPLGGTAVACSLEITEVLPRLDAWHRLLARGNVTVSDHSLVAHLSDDIGLPDLARLVEAEQRCCTFLTFELVAAPSGTVLTITGPDGSRPVLEALAHRSRPEA